MAELINLINKGVIAMKNNKGFALVETLVSLALLMIAIFVFTPIFAYSLQQITYAGNWQNIIIRQRAAVEEQIAERSIVLNNLSEPVTSFFITLHNDDNISYPAIKINGKIINDNDDHPEIKSFISNIYANETLNGSATSGHTNEDSKILVSPQTIYYNEILYGKKFLLYGVNLTFIEDSINHIRIYGGLIDITDFFVIEFDGTANLIKLTVKNNAPEHFYRYAPFEIQYNGVYIAMVNVLIPQIMAVTNKGGFITGYYKGDDEIAFDEGIESISSGSVNDIVYNFHKREYVAVGDSNLLSTFGRSLNWIDNYTLFPSVNNNFAISVDKSNNYMLGSTYNAITQSEVCLSMKDSDFATKSVFAAQTVDDTNYYIETGSFDIIRSSLYVSTYDSSNDFIPAESNSYDYILAAGYYGVKINNDNITYHDLLYAIDSSLQWFGISASSGEPSNMSSVKLTGIADGVGITELTGTESAGKRAEYSILLTCTEDGKIYGISPRNATTSLIIKDNSVLTQLNQFTVGSLNSITFGNGNFVAVGSGTNNVITGTVIKNISDSMNYNINIDWTCKTLANVSFEQVRFINQKFYAVGTEGGKGVIYSSQDGLTWDKLYTTADDCTITSIAGE